MTNFCVLDDASAKTEPQPQTATADGGAKKVRKIYHPHGLGFRLSYQCLIGCRHCYQKSEPGKDVYFEKERLIEVLHEGREAGLQNIGFSGGEPFLYADTVFEGIKVARDIGYTGAIGVVTNGFWGKTAKSAETVIGKMADAGFSPPNGRMNISVGEFHQEWISIETVGNVVEAHWKRFEQPVNFLVTFSKGNGGVFQRLRDHLAGRGLPEEAYLQQIYGSIAYVGRANEVLAGDANPEVPVERYGKCVGINRFSIEPIGKVAPCCGFNRFTEGLFTGSLYTNTVSEVVDQTNRSIVFQYLRHKALHEIHAVLSEKFDLKPGYRHKCELCEALFNKEEHVAYLEEVAARELGPLMQPESLATGTRFFKGPPPGPQADRLTAAGKPPEVDDPAEVAEIMERIARLEAENAQLRDTIGRMTA